MNHCVVTRDQALGAARMELTNQVVIVTAEESWVDLIKGHDLDVQGLSQPS